MPWLPQSPPYVEGGSVLRKLIDVLVNNMALLVLIVSAIGLVQPWTLSWIGPYIPWMLGVVMFGMGMTLTLEDFRTILRRPWEVLLGVVAQFLIMPFVAYVIVKGLQLPPELAIGVILVGTCPGGTASNVISYLAKGDVALSVSMSMATTLLAPIVTPLLTWTLAGAWIDISLTAMMISIAEMVLLPVLVGIACNHFFRRTVERVLPVMPLISVVTIVLLVGGIVALSSGKLLEMGLLTGVAVILHNGFGLLLGYGLAKLCRLDSRKARTVAIEVGMQNSGMAASLAMMYFNPVAAIPGAIFSVWHNISGSLLANFYCRKDTAKKNMVEEICVE